MFPNVFETTLADYQGTLLATVGEGPGPVFPPTNIIRNDEQWNIKVDWEIHGMGVSFLPGQFHIRVFLESIGTGPEFNLPVRFVDTTSAPLVTPPGPVPQRIYTQNIAILLGAIPAGVYKIVTVIHLFQDMTNTLPYPIAGFVEGGMVYVFNPA
ncbi:MAG: hypothetical protein ABI947_14045 [Chloroflexota bacterium]